MSWQFVVLQRTQFTMLSTIMKYFFSHSKFTLPLHLLENIPISKTLTLSFNNQQKLQSPNFLINLSKLYLWQLQRTYISAQALQSSLLLTLWSADYSHHHLLTTEVPVTCLCIIFALIQEYSLDMGIWCNGQIHLHLPWTGEWCVTGNEQSRRRLSWEWCSILNVADLELNSPKTGVCWDLLRRLWPSPAWTFIKNHFMRMSECHTTLQHSHQVCSLYYSHSLKNWNFRQCWEDCEYIYSSGHTEIQKTIFLFLFPGKGSQNSQKTES